MSVTPGKPRQSGIPTPGRPSAIPAPGRSRASSSANQYPPVSSDVEYMSRAFADAIKANDPAQHRGSRASDISSLQSSPPPALLPLQSGRRSVAGRPSSVASSSSAVGTTPHKSTLERSRTPTARPLSRQSDIFGRSVSRAGRAFEVGDNVRIESLGFEGTLQYIGEIEGKSGLWAGVALSGGFSGKGKNSGTVNGKQYFSCPPKCGVFVAATKLSAPTVGIGAYRPPSVASGRGTPSLSASIYSGRTTPSGSNGRVTPSFGHVASSNSTTPAARARDRTLSRSTVKTPTISSQKKTTGLENKITDGSRASQYLDMTAKQLVLRDATKSPSQGLSSPSRSIPSPTRASINVGSPTRSLTSPFHTPKPNGRASNIGVGLPSTTPSKGRPSLATPRARLPSGIAMPPPGSPSGPSRSVSLNDSPLKSLGNGEHFSLDLEANGKALQDKIALLMSGKSTPISAKISSRPPSVASVRSSSHAAELQLHIEQLQSRLDSLQYENQRLRDAAGDGKADELQEASRKIEVMQAEREQANARISDLESQVKVMDRSLNERNLRVESLERHVQQAQADLDRQKTDSDSRLKDLQAKMEDGEAMVKNLKDAIEAKEGMENQNDTLLSAKNAEIALLESRMQKTAAEWDQDRKQLGAQVDELRQAGQETIALYEERLSAADSDRYALEDRISSLEDEARKGANSVSASRQASSAAEIDNETLRDQVQHLQQRIQSLEDMLEDAQAASEREETAARERIRRFKEKEEAMRKELSVGRSEVEQMLKSEAAARGRVEENEEALRESTLALENARAEIEVLRTEVANLDSLAASGSSNTTQRLGDSGSAAANERTRLAQEIVGLKQALAESHITLKELNGERVELRHALAERTAELDAFKKKMNRDVSINSGLQEPMRNSPQSPPSKYDIATAREEIVGLKHIVQTLQMESQSAAQRNKLLESENRMLLSETDQLRQELKLLEDNVEQSLLREEEALNASDARPFSPSSTDVIALQKTLKEQKVKYEMDLEQMRKRLTESERNNRHTDLKSQKEISELEALIESKIYREDELEQELERTKEKLARAEKKSSKVEARPRLSAGNLGTTSDSDVCELCDQPGHDMFNCDGLPPLAPKGLHVDDPSNSFCEDCDTHGHTTANCPHSMDVF